MKIPLLYLSLLLIIPINFISCNRLEDKKVPSKTVVVLVDLSESTKNVRDVYLESFKKILSSIGHGDAIVVAKITDASVTEPNIPIEEPFPEFIPRDAMGRQTDNPTLVKKLKKEADEGLKARKGKLIEDFKGYLFDGSPRTSIMSSLHVAERVFKNYRRDKSILVILSDMIEDSQEYNFERENLTGKRIEEIIRIKRTKNKIPDLKGIKIYVVAAGVKDTKKFFALQDFWLRYLKECGANISKDNYGSALLRFDE